MRKYIALLICLPGLLLPSCNYLDNAPDDQLTLKMVFEDKSRVEEWLAGVYNKIPDPYYFAVRHYDVFGDDITPSERWHPWNWDTDKITGNWNSESVWLGNYWSDFPKCIRSAYIFIDNVKSLPSQQLYEEEVKYMKAECRFLISYYYSLMLMTYGAIPYQTSLSDFTEGAETLMKGQDPFDYVVEELDKELQAVSRILPPYYTENRKYGRATSIMALAVRARLLLFAASPLVNGNADYVGYVNDKGEDIFNSKYDHDKWDRAQKACLELIETAEAAGHQLYYEYNDDGTIDPFMSYSNMSYKEFHQGNKEILFAKPDADYHRTSKHSHPKGSGGPGGLGVTQTLVDAFFMSNGLPAVNGYTADRKPIFNPSSGYSETGFAATDMVWKTKWIEGSGSASVENEYNVVAEAGIYNMYFNREPRFYVSVLFNDAWHRISNRYTNFYLGGQDGIRENQSPWDAPQNGYLMRKRVHPDDTFSLSEFTVYRPGILYRLAEAYLNYAEALNEWDPANRTEILRYINLIRERAGIPLYGGDIPAPSTQEEMRDAIRRERRVELNCEFSIRFDDVRRWKQIELLRGDFDGMNAYGTVKSDDTSSPYSYYVRTVYITRAFTEKNYWFPIHQNQIDKNQNLRQLPGW